MDVKQIHCSFDVTRNFEFEDFDGIRLTEDFISITVDNEDFYYHLPPEPIPEGMVCVSCNQTVTHTPECKYQKNNEFVYLTVDAYRRAGLPEADMNVIRDDITNKKYNAFIQETRRRGRGRPKRQVDTIKRYRFPNHVELNYRDLISIKLNKNKLILMSIPFEKPVFDDVVLKLRDFLRDIVTFDIGNPNVFNVNIQYVLPNLDQTVFTKEFNPSTPNIRLTERSLIPKNAVNLVMAKAVLLKFNLRSKSHKFSVSVFKTGVVQVFISHCSASDVKKTICSGESTFIPFFDPRDFTFTRDTMSSLNNILEFLDANNEAPQLGNRIISRGGRARRHILKKLQSSRVDGYQPRGCVKINRPWPYSFNRGNCSRFDYHVQKDKKYPCCKRIKNKSEMVKYQRPFVNNNSGILKGEIYPGGFAFLDGVKVNINNATRDFLVLQNGRQVDRERFDTEITYSQGLDNISRENVIRMFDFVYDIITPDYNVDSNIFEDFSEEELSFPFYTDVLFPKFRTSIVDSSNAPGSMNVTKDTIPAGLIDRRVVYDMYGNYTRPRRDRIHVNRDNARDRIVPGFYSKQRDTFVSYDNLDFIGEQDYTGSKLIISGNARVFYERDYFDIPLMIVDKKFAGTRSESKARLGSRLPRTVRQGDWYVFRIKSGGQIFPKMKSPHDFTFLSDEAIGRFFT